VSLILDPWVAIVYGRIRGQSMVFYLLLHKDKNRMKLSTTEYTCMLTKG
jgi:hypothetical protein